MNKLLLIPRAVADLISIWMGQQTWKSKSSFTYTFGILKLKKWLARKDSVIDFPLLGKRWKGCNNETLQHLIKEVFLEKVYEVDTVGTHAPVSIIDGGSNIGLSVLFFKTIFPDAVIEAYEPNNQSFQLLQQNIEANGLHQVTAKQCALTANEEPLYWVAGYGPCSQNQQFSTIGNQEHRVAVQRLSHLLNNKKWDVVKLDVEGAELDILKDVIREQCLENATCWLIEFHHPLSAIEPVLGKFEKEGFRSSRKGDVYCFSKKL